MKKRVKKTYFERFHRHRVIQYGLAFDFTTPSPDTKFGITLIGQVDEERRNYEIRFDPPLEKIYGGSSHFSVTHIESKRKDTVITVLPKTEDKMLQGDFMIFPTHVIKSNAQGALLLIYLTIVNNQMRGDINVPIWNPHFNLQWCLNRLLDNRYQALDFFDPEFKGGPVDVSKIPQGSFIANKTSYGLTSSRTGKLLGYFPGTSDFSGWKAVSMRIGRLYEPIIAATYLKHHSDYKFKEIGFTSLEEGSDADGAQIDGLINGEFAVEFKSSKFNCDFEPNYISQCIMEMACGFPHVDLVKFCEKQVKTSGTNIWTTTFECKEIRLYRNKDLEKELIGLCKQSMAIQRANPSKFEALMQTEPYVKMRATLESLATECNQKAKQIPVDLKLIEDIKRYKQNTLDIQMEDSITLDPIIDRIEKRQARIFAAFQEENKEGFVKETMEQIQDYSELVKK